MAKPSTPSCRLLVVNPNTTPALTERVLAEARRWAGVGTTFTGATASFGASVVSTEAEAAVAAHACLDLLARHHPGHDAAIVAMSFDAGVVAARRLLPIPVVGITEAAIHTACLLGRRFGMVVTGAVSLALYLDLLDAMGLRARAVGIEMVDLHSVDAYLDAERLDSRLLDAIAALCARPEIEAVVICGAAMAGAARRLQVRAGVPLIDGVAAATAQAEALVRLRLRPKPRMPGLAAGLAPSGLGDALTAVLAGV